MNKIKLLVSDDHDLVRDGIVSMLHNASDVQVVAEAEDGIEVIKKLNSMPVDVVLTDIMMPNMSGIELAREIKENHSDVKIILLSMEVTEEFIGEAIKIGVNGYLPKKTKKNELLEAIREVSSGGEYFPTSISQVVFKSFYSKKTMQKNAGKTPGKLSDRELEVLKLVANGKTNKEISDELFISIRTVDAHKNNIMGKLQLKNTAELVKHAIKFGLIEI